MATLGEIVTVKLPPHVTERFNSDNPAQSVAVGDIRPALVVGVTATGVNLVIFHDGTAVHYEQNVPLAALTGGPTGETVDAPAWDPAREGTGETYSGTGPYAPALGAKLQDVSPAVGEQVPGSALWSDTPEATSVESVDRWA